MTFPSKLGDGIDIHQKIYSKEGKLTNKDTVMPLLFFLMNVI